MSVASLNRAICNCRNPGSCHNPAAHVERVCCECGSPAQYGEPTCGNVECLESLNAFPFVDLDGDGQRSEV